MEKNEVSEHEARLYVALQKQGREWATSQTLAKSSGIAGRTARAHLRKFVTLNIVDVAEVFPGHRYRLADKAARRNLGYVTRLQDALAIFGLR